MSAKSFSFKFDTPDNLVITIEGESNRESARIKANAIALDSNGGKMPKALN